MERDKPSVRAKEDVTANSLQASNPVRHLFRLSVLPEVRFAAAETDGRRLSSTAQDILHEQRRSEHGSVGL